MTAELSVWFILTACFAPAVSVALLLIRKRIPMDKLGYWPWQIIVGIAFGLVAICGTEFGLPYRDIVINMRDAAPACAALIFGAPAGIIAGLIGGIERWFSVFWGVGAFTQVACTIGTIFAGAYAALLRKYMFEDEMPSLIFGFATGAVIEIFHLTMVFLTNFDQAQKAFEVVEVAMSPMIWGVALSVCLAVLLATLLSKRKILDLNRIRGVAQSIQGGMMIMMVLAFCVTIGFVYALQSGLAKSDVEEDLSTNIKNVRQEISDASDANLLHLASIGASLMKSTDGATDQRCSEIAEHLDVAEVNVVDGNGVIIATNIPEYLGFNMYSTSQTREFMQLLSGKEAMAQSYQPMIFDQSIYRKFAGVSIAGGIILVGNDAKSFQRNIDETVENLTRNWAIGKNGGVIIVDEAGQLRSATKVLSITQDDVKNLAPLVSAHGQNKMFIATISGVPMVCMYEMVEGYYIAALYPQSEADFARNLAVVITAFVEIIIFALLFFIIFLLLKRIIITRMHKVNDGLWQIIDGDLDATINVRENIEFEQLSDGINITVNALKGYINEANARIDEELEYARIIQANSLPAVLPPYSNREEFELYATMTPAKEVGGDFYDFYLKNDNHLAILIADVSGKGIPAALFMMTAKTLIHELVKSGCTASEALERANSELAIGNDSNMFVTCWLAIINLDTGHVGFANAGHNRPAIRHENGSFTFFKQKTDLALAAMDGIPYREQDLTLEPGDTLFVFTDGVTEATNSTEELYDESRLLAALNTSEKPDLKGLCSDVYDDVMRYTGEAEQFDDITMLAFTYKGSRSAPVEASADAASAGEHVIYKHQAMVDASLEGIEFMTDLLNEWMAEVGIPRMTVAQMDIAVDELMSNIVRYAYDDGGGMVTVLFKADATAKTIVLTFIDSGKPFNPLEVEEPDISLSLYERTPGGLGIFLVRQGSDDMHYEYVDECNKVTIVKKYE